MTAICFFFVGGRRDNLVIYSEMLPYINHVEKMQTLCLSGVINQVSMLAVFVYQNVLDGQNPGTHQHKFPPTSVPDLPTGLVCSIRGMNDFGWNTNCFIASCGSALTL